mmetsp:Transcript_30066/g.77563  ORF Transcript_30066/g.77563 Transcript_30066/m.77563 type:complete len:250 (-) Transcript_30066:139-888(-)
MSKRVKAPWAKKAEKVLSKLLKHKHAWVFDKPVDYVALGIPDYPDVIKKPMDLGTIKDKLDGGSYSGHEGFVADVHLVWKNAKDYNGPGSDVYVMADDMQKAFESELSKIDFNEVPAAVGEAPKETKKPAKPSAPKTKEANSAVTYEEKKEFCSLVSQLSDKHLGRLVKHVYTISNSCLSVSDTLVELDVDKIPKAYFGELLALVKKAEEKKMKKKEEKKKKEKDSKKEKRKSEGGDGSGVLKKAKVEE